MKTKFKVLNYKDGSVIVEETTQLQCSDNLVFNEIRRELSEVENKLRYCKPVVNHYVVEGVLNKDSILFLEYSIQRIQAIIIAMSNKNAV